MFTTNQTVTISCATSGATIYYTIDGNSPTILSTQYISPFTLTSTSTVKAIAVKSGMTNSDISTATYTKTEKVASPTFNPLNGSTFTTNQQVTISCATSSATIYYTIGGSTPTTLSTQYISPFTVTSTATVKAIAVKNGMTNSDISTATYTKTEKVVSPTFNPLNGSTFTTSQQVTLSCATSGATIYYTTDGTFPTTSSSQFTSPFTINSTTTIKTIAVKSGMANSDISTATYTKIEKVVSPAFNPLNGSTFTTSQQVTISCGTSGATIYYTIDGSTPTILSTQYISPFTVTSTTTVKAIAIKTGMANSEISNVKLTKLSDLYDYTDNGTNITIDKCKITFGEAIVPSTINDKPVTTIGSQAFYGYTSLTSIILPNNLTSIGNEAFQNCTGLTNISIPSSVTNIGNNVFWNCTGLTNVSIPNGVTIINDSTFALCSNLMTISIPNSITSIGSGAFWGCKNLTSISIPSNVKSIGSGAFCECKSLTNISIPNSVTTISTCAFKDCTGLTSISIPNSVTTISNSAFEGCTSLTSITIPNSISSIENWTFKNCTSLTSVTIPDSVTNIVAGAFLGCSALTNISIPNHVTQIGDNAFEGCSRITSISIPNSVTTIGERAFKSCVIFREKWPVFGSVGCPFSVDMIKV